VSAAEEQAIRALFDSWTLADEELDNIRSLADRFFAPDITYEEDPAWPGAATLTGSREVVDRHLEYRELLGRARAHIEALSGAGGGRWAAAVRIGGESASGAPWDHLWGYSFEMRDGRIKSFRAFFDAARPFEELGLEAELPGGVA
jgi:ketosteroid isomerase-like protein